MISLSVSPPIRRNINIARNVTITEVLSKELNENDIKNSIPIFFIFLLIKPIDFNPPTKNWT